MSFKLMDTTFAMLLDNPMARPLPPDPEAVGTCINEKCRIPLYPGEKAIYYDGYAFCSPDCLAEWLGAEEITLQKK